MPMTIAAAPARQTDRSASSFSPAFATAAKAVAVPVQVPPRAVVSEGLGKDALISWFKGEFAAANAIIDAMCSHLRKTGGGGGGDDEAFSGSEYDAVFAAIHRRRLNWIPVLQMQKYHSIAEVAIELQKVAAKKAEDLKERKTEAEDLNEKKTEAEEEEEEVKKACFDGEKVTENELNGDVEDVEDDSPSSDITDSGSHQDVHQAAATDTQICQRHEDCDARSCEIKPIKGFQAKEQVKGHTVNVVKGLKMYEELLKEDELSKLIDFVADLREAGQNGKLSGDSFILFNKQIKGNKRELIQLGVPIFGHAKDENTNDSAVNIEPIPPLLESVIDHFVTWRLIPEYKRPNGCVINFFEEGEYSQPFLKPPHLEQPISTLVLSESTMAFGRILSSDSEGNFRGPLTLSLKQGSLLVMRGNSADMARHVMCPSQTKRVSITFFRVRPETNHHHSQPNSPHHNDGVMTMWQQQPCHYPMTPTPFLNGYDHSVETMPKFGVFRPPMIMMAPPPLQPMVLSSPGVMGTGGGTGVFLPWASVSTRKHVKHLPPRAQKKRFLPLPPAASSSPAGESTSEPVISVGGA
uniref:Fe2OG dioxygenase domain-containing protein n=1 Tax=Noccaea caerulescens TaxID=107243 RepID=A0A1J3F3G7_NOCCA